MFRKATKTEIKNYEKVEEILTMEETDIIFDVLANAEDFDALVHNKVNNAEIKAILKAHRISAKALSDWYFAEEW